ISVVGSVFYNYIDSLITTALVPGPMGGDVLQYTNSTDPTQTFGAEVEVRREWRQGWMVSGSYAFQRTRRTDLFQEGNPATTDTDFRLSNSPEHLFAFRAAAPIVSEVATLALRLRLESPRLGFALNMDGSTRFVQGEVPVFADLILSGEIREIGLGYAVGVRNMFDWRIQYPGGEDLLPLTFVPQPGRTFFFQTTLTL
ncbi:MAG: TonB-dependent receptor, partial [Sandaracinaceae bacterium]|nr:TonB-dependent receptor [Sandaracinaceae bacterium]